MDAETDTSTGPTPPVGNGDLPTGRFSGPTEFQRRLRMSFACAATQGWPWMVWCDPDFRDWPLCERQVLQDLNAWAGHGRQLRILARRYDEVPRVHPRFVAWRQQWDHIIECRVSGHVPGLVLPSVLLSPNYALERLDMEQSNGWCGHDRQRLVSIGFEVQECFEHGTVGFPATTLGL